MASYTPLEKSSTTEKEYKEKLPTVEEGDIGEEELFLSPSETQWRRARPLPTTLRSWLRKNWLTIVLHVALLLANLLFVALFTTGNPFKTTWTIDQVIESNPLSSRFKYEPRRFELFAIYKHDGSLNPHKPTAFNGPPRPELEAEWDKLMAHSEVRVSEEELGEYGGDDSIVELGDKSGYYVTVSAFHGLHCVRRLHQFLYPDVYYSDATEYENWILLRHAEHCLDWLRQYVQCHADPTLIPIHWTTNDNVPVSKDIGNRQCVAWEPLEEWMAAHSFNPSAPGMLVHPLFGVPETINSSRPALGSHELGHGGLLHKDGRKGDGTFQ